MGSGERLKEASVGSERFLHRRLHMLLGMPVRDWLAQISASSQTREQVQQAAGGHEASTQPFNYSRPGDGDVSAGDAASQDANLTSRLSARLPCRDDCDGCVILYLLFISILILSLISLYSCRSPHACAGSQ